MKIARWGILTITLSACLTCGQRVQATIVAPMTVQSIADHSAMVIDAHVVSVQSYWAQNPTRIESEVTLSPIEILKGASTSSTGPIKLIVPGGTVGTRQMRIAGAPELNIGDRWILCLLPTYKTHPVTGITHGAIQVIADDQQELRVVDASGHQISGIDAKGFIKSSGPRHIHATDGSVANTTPVEAGITRDEFVALLQPILDNSKTHHLAVPAGTRLLVDLTPVPYGPPTGSVASVPSANRLSPPMRDLADQRNARTAPKANRSGDPR